MSDVFKALADATRRAILDELANRDDQTLFELCARLASKHGVASSRQAVSQHIDVLVEAGLVVVRRQSRYKFHRLDPQPLEKLTDRWLYRQQEGPVKITLTSVFVDDQEKALAFYTDILGFQKKVDVPLGEHRWLTVVSPAAPEGVELVLEPDDHPAAKQFKTALVADGIPFTSFTVDNIDRDYQRLVARGVRFTQPPTAMGPVVTAVLDDTCGNLIQLATAPAAL